MKKVRLKACYYEWHLVDENDKILLNITDSNIDACETEKELLETIDVIWNQAYYTALRGDEFNGIAQEELDDDWKFVIARRLFKHYGFKTAFLDRVEKFRKEVLESTYSRDLSLLDWYITLETALQS